MRRGRTAALRRPHPPSVKKLRFQNAWLMGTENIFQDLFSPSPNVKKMSRKIRARWARGTTAKDLFLLKLRCLPFDDQVFYQLSITGVFSGPKERPPEISLASCRRPWPRLSFFSPCLGHRALLFGDSFPFLFPDPFQHLRLVLPRGKHRGEERTPRAKYNDLCRNFFRHLWLTQNLPVDPRKK